MKIDSGGSVLAKSTARTKRVSPSASLNVPTLLANRDWCTTSDTMMTATPAAASLLGRNSRTNLTSTAARPASMTGYAGNRNRKYAQRSKFKYGRHKTITADVENSRSTDRQRSADA